MKIFKTLLIIDPGRRVPGFAADANKIVVDGSTTVGPIAKAFAEYYMKQHPGVNITVSESGSGNGAKSLINGSCEVATMSRLHEAERVRGGRAQRSAARGPCRGPGRHRHDRPSRQPGQRADHGAGQGHLHRQDQELEPARRPQRPDRHHHPRHQQRHLRDLRRPAS